MNKRTHAARGKPVRVNLPPDLLSDRAKANTRTVERALDEDFFEVDGAVEERFASGPGCVARVESDEYVCHRCDIRWGFDDEKPEAARCR